MKRPITSRRTQLLARSALCGVLGAIAIGASSTAAQVTGVGTINSTTSNGGAVGVVSGGGVTDITTNASRSIVNWADLTVTPTEALNFYFNNRGDIVVNRVAGAASIDGILNGCMATCATTGGNIWILSTGGVLIGANTQINTGGFLASTGSLTDGDILDGDMNFAFTGAPANSTISVAGGASLNTSGGSLALIAPIVTTAAGSTVTATDGGDVIYGSAENYNVTFAPTGADDLDLITFEVPSRADGSGGTPGLTLNGTTNANQVFAAIVSKSGVAASILLGGDITATTASGENGDIVLSAGSGFFNGIPLNPGGGFEGGITQDAGSILTGANVTMRAADAIVAGPINATGQVWLDSAWAGISQTGAITASNLRVESGAGIDLTDAGNDFDTISFLDNNGSGLVSLTDADGFHLTGGVNNWVAAGTVNLTALNGSITQSGLGVIWAGTLNASATGDIALGNLTNHLATLGTLTAGGAVSYRGGSNFNLDGAVTAASLSLVSNTGAINQTGAPLNVGQLSVQAETGINLNRVSNQVDEITGLSTTSGDIILISNGDLSLAGNVVGSGLVSFHIFNGAITQNSGVITANAFQAIADAGLDLGGANQVAQLGRLSAGGTGDIIFRNAGALVLTDDITAAGDDVNLYSTSGGITQDSGEITANRLTASAAGNIQFNTATNNAATIGGLASTSGSILYRNANSFDIQGDITTAVGTGAVLRTVNAGASITQVSGTVDVGWFGANASGSIIVNGANNLIRRLVATSSSNGDVSIRTTTDLAMGQPVTASQALSLTSDGRIYQDSTGYVVANTLNLSAVTGISLPNAGPIFVNSVQNLGTITNTTSGGIVIANYSGSNTGLTGNITAAGQSVSITDVAGGLNQTGGTITADTLSLSATGGISATQNNTINNLGPVASGGNFSFVNTGQLYLTGDIASAGQTVSLTTNSGQIEQTSGGIITANILNLAAGGRIWVNNANAVNSLGAVTAGSHVLFRNSGDVVVGGDVTATGFDVTLRSNSGSITQTAGSDITSNSLQVIAQTGVTLTNAGNSINQLAWADVLGSGGFAFSQTNGFQIAGPVMVANAGTISLTSLSGGITQTASFITTGGTLNLAAAGTIDLDGSFNNVGSLGTVTTGGAFLYQDVTGFTLTGNITAANQVELTANNGGTIEQTGGIITADSIDAVAEGDLLLGSANQINTVTNLAAANNLLYRQVGDLSVPTISAAGTISLYSTTGDITQTGTITADTLVLGAGDDITLGQNFVSKLGQIDAGGDFTAADAGGLSSGALELTDDITVGGAMTLVNPGAITQTDGAITAGNLILDTDGALTATGANSISGNTRLSALDATFNAAGDLTIQVNTTGFAALSSTGAVVIDGVGASTGDTLVIQAANGISQGAQTLTFTNFGNLTNTTSGGISLTNSNWLTLNGAISAVGQGVTLNVASGGIIQSSGSNINARRLSVTTTQGAVMNEMNQVAELGVIDVGAHNFSFRTFGDLLIDGDVTSSLNVMLTSATGGVTQTAGSDITAGGLTVWAETGIYLLNAGNDVDRLMTVINLGSGGIAYGQTNGFLIDGTVRALNQTVNLISLAGGIAETGNIFFPQIEAGTLNISAAGAITLHRDNDINNLGVVSAGAGFTFNDVDGFNLTGNLTSGGAVVLDALNGSIVQTGGVINATSIDAAASGNLDLGSANVVGAVTALSAGGDILYRQVGNLSVPAISANGSLSLYSTTGSITQTGAVTAATLNAGAATGIALNNSSNNFGALGTLSASAGNISLYDASGIDLTGAITTSNAGFVSLTAVSGAITQQAGATIGTGILSLSATTGATLEGDNDVDTLGPIIVGPSFSFNDVDGFDIGGTLYATTANLTSGGAITQSTGVLGVGILSLTAASVTLNGANDIAYLGDVDVTGNMSFSDTNGVFLDGVQAVDGTLALTAGTFVTQQGGGLDVGRLEIDAGTDVAINLAGNVIDTLGDVASTSGSIAIVNNAVDALEIDGDVSASAIGQTVYISSLGSGVTMTSAGSITSGANSEVRGAGDIVLGNIDAGGALTVVAAGGSVSSTAAPTIVAAQLTGTATTGSFVLTGANIDIDQIGYIEVRDTFSITGNNGSLDLSNNIIAQTVSLGTTGALTQTGGSVDATTGSFSAGGSLTMATLNAVDTVSLNGASVTYNSSGSFAANVVTSTGAVSLTSNTGKITQTALTGRIVADSLTASAATGLEFFGGQNDIRILAGLSSTSGGVTWRDMGGFEITGNINATGQTVELVSDGTGADGNHVVQTSGVITANRLQGTSAGDLLFNNANAVGQLGYLNSGGNIRYRGAASFTLQDNVNTGGGLILNSDTGSIQQFGGAIVVGAFSGSAAQGISLSRVNDVDTLGAIDSGAGDFNFRDIDSFDIAGLVTSDTGIMLQAGGGIFQTSGSVVTGTLSLFTNGGADLSGSGNDIDFLGLSTAMTGLQFADVDGFGVSDRVFSTGTISLAATTGDIVEATGGYLSAQSLNVHANAGDIDLSGDNVIENVGDLVAGGDVTFHEIDGFTLGGNITGDAVELTVDDGAINQTSGAITANTLRVEAVTGILLDSGANNVNAIAGMTNAASGGISYTDADYLDIAGAVNALGQTVTFTVGNSLSQSGTGVISARRVQGWAGGDFGLGALFNNVSEIGPISAIGISFRAAGALALTDVLSAGSYVSLLSGGPLTQAAGAAIFAPVLRAQAAGDITLTDNNDVDSIELLLSVGGNVSYADTDGFSLDGAFSGDIWAQGGSMTLTAGGGSITQTGAGLIASSLTASAGGDIILNRANQVGSLGAMSSGGDIVYVDLNDIALSGDIVTGGGGAFVITSTTGAVTQTAGLITSQSINGSAAGAFTLNNFDGALGDISSVGSDIGISNAADITFNGLISTSGSGSVTLASGGYIQQGASGRVQTALLNLSAGDYIDLTGALRNDVDSLGSVSVGTSFNYIDDNDFDLTADIDAGASVYLESLAGRITQTGGRIATDGLTVVTQTGADLSRANLVGALEITNGAGDVYFTNARDLGVVSAISGGLVDIQTTTGRLDVLGQIDAGSIVLTGANGAYAAGLLQATGDVTVTAVTGNAMATQIISGDDVLVQATAGSAQVQDISLYAGVDSEADGQNLTITAAGDAFLGAASEGAISSEYLSRISGAGTVSVTSTGGNAGVFLAGMNTAVDTLSAGGDDGTASMVVDGNITLGSVSGDNVFIRSTNGVVNVAAVTLGGGDYTLYGEDFSTGAFAFIGSVRDISITDTAGDLTIDADMAARRNLTVEVLSGSLLDGTGNTSLVAGAGGQGDLSIVADNITMSGLTAQGDVTLNAGVTGDITVGLVIVDDDYNLTGGSFNTGALAPLGFRDGTWTITAGGAFDFSGETLTYRGDIAIHAADVIIGGSVQSILGSVLIDSLSDIDIEGLHAATDITAESATDLIIDTATSSGGDVNLLGRSVRVDGFVDAARHVLVTATDGQADVEAATAGRDIRVAATDGDARLGQAILTGVTGDLNVLATNGAATLGAIDFSTIGSNNYFQRAVGSTGTVSVVATGGGANVYLDHSDGIDLVQGEQVDVTVETGDLMIGALTALNDDVYAEVLDGTLTIGDATAANGGVGLHAFGGDLTITGSVYGGLGVTVETDGLLDGRLAASIDTAGDLDLAGGSVLLDSISADGFITVAALDGDAYVEFANAGGSVQVGSLTGDATLRGAEAPDGIAVFAANTATFGADDSSLITGSNYGITGGGCGCGPGAGISVISLDGDVVVNLRSVTGGFDVIGAAIDGDATVYLETGDLIIGDLAAFNIDIAVEDGALETASATSSGGNYRLKAQDFRGDVLNPTLFAGTLGDYTVTDTLGGLDMTGVSVMAQGDIRIDVWNGALTGDGQLSSVSGTGQGDVAITAAGITLGSVEADGDLVLSASAGDVDVATSVSVGGSYLLTGQSFSGAALTPLGARAGVWSLTDTLGDLDYSAGGMTYVGDIAIHVSGLLTGGDITSSAGDILIQAQGINGGALSAVNGSIIGLNSGGDVVVSSAAAGNFISLSTGNGDVVLGSAALLGTGANSLSLSSAGGGNVILGAAAPGLIGAGHVFTSAGSSTSASLAAAGGDAFVNLDRSDALTTIFGAEDVGVTVRNGDFTVGSITASGGRVDVDGPDGALVIGDVYADTDALIRGGDITLTDGEIGQDLTVDATGDIDFRTNGRIGVTGELSVAAGGLITQAADAGLTATGLTVNAGAAVNLSGVNQIEVIRAVDTAAGGFAYRSTRTGGFDIAGAINAAGQTVHLRAENGGIFQSGGAIVAGRLTGASDGGVWLAGGNLIGELGDFANTGGAFFLNVDQALSIVGVVDGAAALRIQSGPMTIASTGTVRSAGYGDAVILASDGVFANNSGADGVQAANGRWLIYSQAAGNPGGSTSGNNFGGLGGKSYYGSAYDFGSGAFSAAPNGGNRFVYAYQPTLTVTPISQRITYNGQIPTLGAIIAGLINGDLAADAWSGAPTLSGATSKNAGTYGLSAALGSLLSDMNYAFSFGSGTLIIDPKALTGTVTADSKTYDGGTDAVGFIGLDGVVAGDAVVATATGFRFADRNAGVGKIVTALGAALSGADAGNYTLGSVGTAVADILRRSLTGVLTANNKTYDGTTAATGSIGLTGVVAGDAVSASGTFSFADRNAGLGKVVNASGLTLSGADAGNYDLGPISGVADILRRSIGGTIVASNKTYDGSTAATGSINLTGVVAGDDIRANGALAFDSRNAGVGQTVSAANAALSGADAGNYTLADVANGIADILRRAITVTADNQSKRFGQDDPSLTYVVGGGGLVAGDVLTGGLVRVAGETAGVYAIGQGDLAASSNYALTFTPGEFVIQIPPAGGVQSLQMLRTLGETSTFALDRDPSPSLIVDDGEDERDPDDNAGVRPTSD